ncbi:MAG: hypothetical protein ACPGVB_02890 [Chitinophagales bacterium]
MKHYLHLQSKRLYRHLQSAGIHPLIGFSLLLFLFIALSEMLFLKLSFAAYLYPLFPVSLVNLFGKVQRNDFLKSTFSTPNYRKIRIAENLIVTIPFVLFLFFKQEFLIAFVILPIAVGLSFFNQINRFQFVIPTPFYRFPFEFTRGFRQYYWLFGLCYWIAVISTIVGNFNIGIFTLLFVFLSCLSFYGKPESEFYVWVHSAKPSQFLFQKIKICILYASYLSIPILILLAIFYPDKLHIILLAEFLGISYLITVLLGKYAYFPSEINLIPGFLITISLFLPPFLLIVIPFLFLRAKRNLQSILSTCTILNVE